MMNRRRAARRLLVTGPLLSGVEVDHASRFVQLSGNERPILNRGRHFLFFHGETLLTLLGFQGDLSLQAANGHHFARDEAMRALRTFGMHLQDEIVLVDDHRHFVPCLRRCMPMAQGPVLVQLIRRPIGHFDGERTALFHDHALEVLVLALCRLFGRSDGNDESDHEQRADRKDE